MGAAHYNRGSRAISRQADACMPEAISRAADQSQRDEIGRLRDQVDRLQRQLRRARRCIASERYARGQLAERLAGSERAYEFAVSVLCRLAFPSIER
jgi:hypothetical protein